VSFVYVLTSRSGSWAGAEAAACSQPQGGFLNSGKVEVRIEGEISNSRAGTSCEESKQDLVEQRGLS
jgi:hypothetical protein